MFSFKWPGCLLCFYIVLTCKFFMMIPLSQGWLGRHWSHSVVLHHHQQAVLVAELMPRYCCQTEVDGWWRWLWRGWIRHQWQNQGLLHQTEDGTVVAVFWSEGSSVLVVAMGMVVSYWEGVIWDIEGYDFSWSWQHWLQPAMKSWNHTTTDNRQKMKSQGPQPIGGELVWYYNCFFLCYGHGLMCRWQVSYDWSKKKIWNSILCYKIRVWHNST